jgi:hypothetical protein
MAEFAAVGVGASNWGTDGLADTVKDGVETASVGEAIAAAGRGVGDGGGEVAPRVRDVAVGVESIGVITATAWLVGGIAVADGAVGLDVETGWEAQPITTKRATMAPTTVSDDERPRRERPVVWADGVNVRLRPWRGRPAQRIEAGARSSSSSS